MKLPIIITPGENGWIVAECPAIPGCISQGKTKEEAIENIKEAIEGCILTRKEMGLPPVEEIAELEVAL
ncbi:type II toxin-antitoxin system HicB family antitoxin [Syntrophomonas wolfei]|jgi:predicted RNase H-like HicB family nuclease|nr:type II toxin-antitoxin system HicB family antitoxin [Syntrophomonas wolfei]